GRTAGEPAIRPPPPAEPAIRLLLTMGRAGLSTPGGMFGFSTSFAGIGTTGEWAVAPSREMGMAAVTFFGHRLTRAGNCRYPGDRPAAARQYLPERAQDRSAPPLAQGPGLA